MRTRTPKIAVAALATATAALISAGSAPAATAHNWQTCKPGAKEYVGAYRVFDNAWLGPSSKHFCVSSTGLNITIDSNAIPDGGLVVAYPNVRFGPFEADGDPRSGGLWRVSRIGSMPLHVAIRGEMDGPMQSDADLCFRPRAKWTQHGTYEMVLINRRTTGYPRNVLQARIRGAKYRYMAWTTCQRGSTVERRALAVLNPAHTQAALASVPILRPAPPHGLNTAVVAGWLIAVAAIIAVGVAAAIRWPAAAAALIFQAGYAAGMAWARLRSFGTWLLAGVKRMIE